MPRANRLFDSLGPATRERLRPHIGLVTLAKGRVLCEPGDVPRFAYFPLDGMISLPLSFGVILTVTCWLAVEAFVVMVFSLGTT